MEMDEAHFYYEDLRHKIKEVATLIKTVEENPYGLQRIKKTH